MDVVWKWGHRGNVPRSELGPEAAAARRGEGLFVHLEPVIPVFTVVGAKTVTPDLCPGLGDVRAGRLPRVLSTCIVHESPAAAAEQGRARGMSCPPPQVI